MAQTITLNWSKELEMNLSLRNKIGLWMGIAVPPPPENVQEMRVWNKCNTLVKSWIIHSVAPKIKKPPFSTLLLLEKLGKS